jgi:hypothetical protein
MNQKNVFASRTVQGLCVVVLVRVLAHFGVVLPDSAANDIMELAVTVAAALYSAYGYAAAAGSPVTALRVFGLLVQYAPQVQKISAEISEAAVSKPSAVPASDPAAQPDAPLVMPCPPAAGATQGPVDLSSRPEDNQGAPMPTASGTGV